MEERRGGLGGKGEGGGEREGVRNDRPVMFLTVQKSKASESTHMTKTETRESVDAAIERYSRKIDSRQLVQNSKIMRRGKRRREGRGVLRTKLEERKELKK
jgi:hypothetical protein